jgi:hypothetical protein
MSKRLLLVSYPNEAQPQTFLALLADGSLAHGLASVVVGASLDMRFARFGGRA